MRCLIEDLKACIQKTVIANSVGHARSHAHGISIYFPITQLEQSYTQTPFARSSSWLQFLQWFISIANQDN